MKKYFLIAAMLGVFAFGSVSFIAQAQDEGVAAENVAPSAEADPSDGEAAADEAAAEDMAPSPARVAPKDERITADHTECTEKAEETTDKDGGAPSDEQIDNTYKDCMRKKFHTADDIKKIKQREEEGTLE